MGDDLTAFLAHYGVKGMKWGVRKDPDSGYQRQGAGKAGSFEPTGGPGDKPKMSRKKKVAIGVGVTVGIVALVAAGSVVANRQVQDNKTKTLSQMKRQAEANNEGRKRAQAQIQTFGKKSKWEIMSQSPSTPSAPKSTPKVAPKQPKFRSKETRLNEARAKINEFEGRSKWEMSTRLPPAQNTPKKNSSYTKKDVRKDTKLYGDKGRTRIEKNVNKGMLLSDARKREATRQHGVTAVRIAMGVGNAQRKEKKHFEQMRRERAKK